MTNGCEIKIVSSMEKCFLDDKIDDKKEKNTQAEEKTEETDAVDASENKIDE